MPSAYIKSRIAPWCHVAVDVYVCAPASNRSLPPQNDSSGVLLHSYGPVPACLPASLREFLIGILVVSCLSLVASACFYKREDGGLDFCVPDRRKPHCYSLFVFFFEHIEGS